MKIEKFSHHFVVSDFTEMEKRYIGQFINRFSEIAYDRFGTQVIVKRYASTTKSFKEFRLHINSFSEFIEHLKDRGLNIDKITIMEYPLYEAEEVKYDPITFVPRDYQEPIIDFILNSKAKAKLVELQAGKGKANWICEPVMTMRGWKAIGELGVGDIIANTYGKWSIVEGVYPQGKMKLYKITFADGRTSVCTLDHLWQVEQRNTSAGWKVVTTEEIIRILGLAENSRQVHIPLVTNWIGTPGTLPIHPYLLGALIGDGSISSVSIGFSKGDKHILDKVDLLLGEYNCKLVNDGDPYSWRITKYHHNLPNLLKEKLTELRLIYKRSYEKSIPENYLNSNLENRWQLLQGLMDTDGTSGKKGGMQYCTTSYQLALDVQYLIRSLGGICKIYTKQPYFTHKGERKAGREAYILNIRHSTPERFFTLPRKQERVSNDNQYAKNLRLRILSVEEIGEGEAVCIKTSAPNSLYITRDFVVTHNTGTSLYAMYQCKKRFAVATKGGFVGRWISDICGEESVLKLKYDRVIEVKGSVGLKRVIELALQDELDFDAILISTNTLSNYYQHYFENDGNMEEYGGLHPVALWALLKIEHLITDEFHLLLHMNYIREMFNHIPSTIALSATIIPDTPLLTKVYATLFPPESIAPAPVYDKYINVKAYFYGTHPDTKQIKCMRNGKYSHTMYEESILKHKKVTKRYLDMIALLTNGIYVGDDKHLPSEKMVIYVSTKAMATEVTNYLNKLYGEKYVIKRFISEDPYSNVLESHIIVSTPLSLGTAHDIADLRFILLTTAIGKEDTNEQLKSRLRRLKNNPTVNPTMYYLVNRDVNKHIVYHRKKRENFKSTTLSQEEFDTPFRV